MKAIKIPTDPAQPICEHEIPNGDLKHMQEAVGGYIEAVSVGRPDLIAYVNEDGFGLGLPLNTRAANFCEQPVIAGDCIVLGFAGDNERDCPMTVEEVTFFAGCVRSSR